jgi:hypothetical protein
MNEPKIFPPIELTPGIFILPASLPIPGMGWLPVSSFLIRGEEPVLIDTGVQGLKDELFKSITSLIDLDDLRWIWLTHADPDHTGALPDLISAASNATLVTSFLGAAKLGLRGIQSERTRLVENGAHLDIGDRQLQATRPPYYDAPESLAVFDPLTRSLFAADAFGALCSTEQCAIEPPTEAALTDGLDAFTAVDVPWLGHVDPARMQRLLDGWSDWQPERFLSSHLAPQSGITNAMRAALDTACRNRRAEIDQSLSAGND